jgi:prepilin-type N-terminal cleavage/methylation domain-containing protein
MRSARGYSLFELMLTLTVVAILAAVAYPSLLRARSSAIEASTVTSMRAIVSAQAVFAASCASGFHAPSLSWLTRSGVVGRDGFLGPEFSANVVDRLGYRMRFTAGPASSTAPKTCNGLGAGQSVREYFVAGDPVDTTGAVALGRHFGINASGSMFVSIKRVRPAFSGVPPPPAKPL